MKSNERKTAQKHSDRLSVIVVLIASAILALIGCNKSGNNSTIKGADSPGHNISTVLETPGTSVYDDTAHVNLDTLVGCFVSNQEDTLICKGIDSCTVRIYSASNRIKPLQIDNVFGIFVVEEGDLDGNGTDEIGIRTEGFMGNWRDYNVFTCIKGIWELLIPPVIVYDTDFYETLSRGEDVVKPSKQKGYIDVRFSSWRNDDICLVDTVIKVKPQPWEKRKDIGVIN